MRHLSSSSNSTEGPDAADTVLTDSGNVFADLGLENPDSERLKADLVLVIGDRIEELGLSQTKAAHLIGLSQPDVSKLLRGRTGGYSLDRLLGFIRALGRDVEINVTVPAERRDGRMSLRVDHEPV